MLPYVSSALWPPENQSFPPPQLFQIIYLRQFKCLRTLSLSGNPITQAEDYKIFICAYLPDLVYLDFRRIDDHMASVFLSVPQICETAQVSERRDKESHPLLARQGSP